MLQARHLQMSRNQPYIIGSESRASVQSNQSRTSKARKKIQFPGLERNPAGCLKHRRSNRRSAHQHAGDRKKEPGKIFGPGRFKNLVDVHGNKSERRAVSRIDSRQ
jgi:hypothetical protein